jgi:hypothetical protein
MRGLNLINLGLHQRRLLGNARQRRGFADAFLIGCKKPVQHAPHSFNGFGGGRAAEK